MDAIDNVKRIIASKIDALGMVGRNFNAPDSMMSRVWLALDGNAASRIYNSRIARYMAKVVDFDTVWQAELSHALRAVEIDAEAELSANRIAEIHAAAHAAAFA